MYRAGPCCVRAWPRANNASANNASAKRAPTHGTNTTTHQHTHVAQTPQPPNQPKPTQTNPNQIKPNQTKPNQTKPKTQTTKTNRPTIQPPRQGPRAVPRQVVGPGLHRGDVGGRRRGRGRRGGAGARGRRDAARRDARHALRGARGDALFPPSAQARWRTRRRCADQAIHLATQTPNRNDRIPQKNKQQAALVRFLRFSKPPKRPPPRSKRPTHADLADKRLPAFLNGRALRPYQEESLHWMVANWRGEIRNGGQWAPRNCLLGDEVRGWLEWGKGGAHGGWGDWVGGVEGGG